MMTKNKAVLGMAAAGIAVVGSVVTTAIMTATIVANEKNKEAIDKMDNEMREKNKRFKDIEEFKKEEIEKLKVKKEKLEDEIAELEALKRKRKTEFQMIIDSMECDNTTKGVLSVVSGIHDSLLKMSETTRELEREMADLKSQLKK